MGHGAIHGPRQLQQGQLRAVALDRNPHRVHSVGNTLPHGRYVSEILFLMAGLCAFSRHTNGQRPGVRPVKVLSLQSTAGSETKIALRLKSTDP